MIETTLEQIITFGLLLFLIGFIVSCLLGEKWSRHG
ncbi:hypothetical protein LCGC14_0406390 [marine sediment metagenome]|uniref:Uncharacterized protein n=1 Tax=marine sediment metagenome TaxID=412755 RepID=A0A0F9SVD3_9ZZZZ